MFLKGSSRYSAKSALAKRHREERTRPAHPSARTRDSLELARTFYCDTLRGRQVWDTDGAGSSGGALSFIVSGTRIDVSTNIPAADTPVVLTVSDPHAVAERCWDAGYSVRVSHETEPAATVSVIDPFGRRIDLVR